MKNYMVLKALLLKLESREQQVAGWNRKFTVSTEYGDPLQNCFTSISNSCMTKTKYLVSPPTKKEETYLNNWDANYIPMYLLQWPKVSIKEKWDFI